MPSRSLDPSAAGYTLHDVRSKGHPCTEGRVGEAHEGLRGTEEGPGVSVRSWASEHPSHFLGRALPLSRAQHPPSSRRSPLMDSVPCSSGQDSRLLHRLRILEPLEQPDEASCSAQPQSLSEGKLRPGLGGTYGWWQVHSGPRVAATDSDMPTSNPLWELTPTWPRPAAPGHWAWASFSAWEVV